MSAVSSLLFLPSMRPFAHHPPSVAHLSPQSLKEAVVNLPPMDSVSNQMRLPHWKPDKVPTMS